MGRATSKGNEAKSKMKHRSDMPRAEIRTRLKLDDLIVCLVGMGFDLEDCQQAVQVGKLSVEAAVEWILSGKPACGQPSQGSTLKLTQRKVDSIGANPFTGETSAAAPISVSQPPAVSDVREDVDDVATPEDDGIISRCHMNEEQRRIKERFQEKQREEARKSGTAGQTGTEKGKFKTDSCKHDADKSQYE
ncbi:hypothetical protein LSH36_47g02028 [Paralvinella palmiformis]|uniref:UBA domain-containing protein n=1 Tax=Paralvinella palmiformis TaxID=53620 RepID=A0AAD9K6L9_9ANNE|nr:hypothetical protein LSH36_47g02028 [Paralvinella palmiformis]